MVMKVGARIRARGPLEVATLGWHRLRESVASSDTLIILGHEAGTGGGPDAGGELRFREAIETDGPAYARAIGTDSGTTLAARLSDSTHCFLVESGGRIVHATWVTTSGAWTREVGGYLVPPEGDAYIYESFTRSDARGRGVYPFALRHIVAWGQKEGIRRLWVGVEASNEPSLRAVAKAGFDPLFEIAYRRSAGRLHVRAPRCSEGRERLCLMTEAAGEIGP